MTIKYIRHPDITREDNDWCDKEAEKQFHSLENDDVAGEEECSFDISKLFPYALTVIKTDDKIIGYTYILPTTNDLMQRFINGTLNEKKVIQEINKNIRYNNCDAAYLAGAVISEEYQNKGYAVRATIDTLLSMDSERGMKIRDIYIWPFTDAMHNMIGKAQTFAERYDRKLHVFESENNS